MLKHFICARYRFVLEAQTPLRLSAFAGATLRGGFGHVFKRAVCVWPPGDCPRCLLKSACAYAYVFETAPAAGAEKLSNYDQVPRPFVVEPPEGGRQRVGPGERFDFALVLVGRGLDYLPYCATALASWAEPAWDGTRAGSRWPRCGWRGRATRGGFTAPGTACCTPEAS